jgi:hypothetical protein
MDLSRNLQKIANMFTNNSSEFQRLASLPSVRHYFVNLSPAPDHQNHPLSLHSPKIALTRPLK